MTLEELIAKNKKTGGELNNLVTELKKILPEESVIHPGKIKMMGEKVQITAWEQEEWINYGYAAPEIIFGKQTVNHKAQLFTYGMLMYFIQTGQNMYEVADITLKELAVPRYDSLADYISNPRDVLYWDHICMFTKFEPSERFKR